MKNIETLNKEIEQLKEQVKTLEQWNKELREKDKYNGYTNYETWNYKLWLDNEQASQEYWRDRAIELDFVVYDLKEELKNEVMEFMPEIDSFYSDILTANLGMINFYEIAEDIINEAKEYQEHNK